jgi:hypothetical protein
MRATKPARFVVYYTETTVERARYYSRHHAEALVAKLARRNVAASVATVEDYNTKVVHMVERVNLMSGKKYMEPSNTPSYCSPSSEAYWSM